MVLDNLIKKLRSPKKNKSDEKSVYYFSDFKKFREEFFENPHHTWIKEHPAIVRSFDHLFDLLTLEQVSKLFYKTNIIFLKGNGKISCSLPSLPNTHFILVFPELYQLLKSASPTHALAILAHELGHILCEHTQNNIHPIIAQFEADQFVCALGLKKELIDVLNDYKYLEECQVRIKKLKLDM